MEKIYLNKLVGKAVKVTFTNLASGEEYHKEGVVFGYGIRDKAITLVIVTSDGVIHHVVHLWQVKVLYPEVGL